MPFEPSLPAEAPSPPASNAPEWSVTDLAGALKRTLEDAFGHVRLRGEISGYRGPHSSGHVYFSLKDQGAKIDAVMWKGVFARLRIKPQDGLEVIATGKITTFPGKSTYQIVVETLEPAGIGALMALLDERRRVLTAEGLFAEARKRPLPFLPQVIGVITSPTGAVIRDILHRLADRFALPVLVWPVRVQGETSADEVAAAIAGFNALPESGPVPRPDVIIVARGGGSLEDLWSFNEEKVVRAAANSAIPLISAIGHETDWTLLDLVADRRAPTPTGAAEIAVPVRLELLATLHDLARRHQETMIRLMMRRRTDLRALLRALPEPDSFLALKRQTLDWVHARLQHGFGRTVQNEVARLQGLQRRLQAQTPQARLNVLRARLEGLSARLQAGRGALLRAEQVRLGHRRDGLEALGIRHKRAFQAMLDQKQARLAASSQLLASLSYKSVLARGFVVVRDADDKPVRFVKEIAAGDVLNLEFGDGLIKAKAELDLQGCPASKAAPVKSVVKPVTSSKSQGDLF
jgi:exodeoxyribonuclease VII large subunit